MFKSLCGEETMRNVVIVTTMWSKLKGSQALGEMREAELKKVHWADMVAQGCKVERFENTYESAWRVLHDLEKPTTAAENAQRAQAVGRNTAHMKVELSRSGEEPKMSFFGWIKLIFGLSRSGQ